MDSLSTRTIQSRPLSQKLKAWTIEIDPKMHRIPNPGLVREITQLMLLHLEKTKNRQ